MAIELVTFGGLHILDDENELDWLAGQRARAALLVYLAVERRVSREALTTVFWPESDTESARHALRQGLYQIKKSVQAEWVESRAHELEVSADVTVDVHAFMDAIERGDLDSAVELYRGAFLDGVHLVDQSSWETWVDSKRAYYARTFRKACRDLIESKRVAGDIRRAISVAEMWTAKDPLDGEAQYRLIEILGAAGERAEAVRQYETYLRSLESDGLKPSEELLSLIERIRSERSQLPPGEPVAISGIARNTSARFNRRIVIAAVGLLAIAVLLWRSTTRRGSDTSVASTIVVLPFSIHGSESVRYLREGMVNLLAVALDGAGTLRPVDMRAMLGAIGSREDSIVQPDEIAGRVNAAMYLSGDVVETGDRMQIEAAIYRRGTREPEARAVVTGSRDSVFSLTDKLAAQLLAGMSDPAAGRLVRTASMTTSSLSAFKDYLEGDRLMRGGQFERAAESYMSAVTHDSTFAVAYYRLGLAREWAPLPGEDSAASLAAHFGTRLSIRDRNLLEAFRLWRSGRALEAERAYRAILARYPDDVDAWFQLGEIQFHHGPLFGRRLQESEEAWRKVLTFENENLFAVTHLARIAVIDSRAASVDSLLSRFSEKQLRTDRRLVELSLLRAVMRGDSVSSKALAFTIREWEGLAAWRVAVFLTAFAPSPRAMRPIVQDLIAPDASPSLRADVLWFASLLDLASGQPNQSWQILTRAWAEERRTAPERRRIGFDAVTEWYVVTLPLPFADSTLARVRKSAVSFRTDNDSSTMDVNRDTGLGTAIQLEPLKQYTVGILSLRLNDTATGVSAASRLEKLARLPNAKVLTRDLDRGLRARIEWKRGRSGAALELLDQMECNDVQGDVAATPFVARAAERFLHGEILSATGRRAEAQRWFSSLGYGSVSEVPLREVLRLTARQ